MSSPLQESRGHARPKFRASKDHHLPQLNGYDSSNKGPEEALLYDLLFLDFFFDFFQEVLFTGG
jgi:hypothetical protein